MPDLLTTMAAYADSSSWAVWGPDPHPRAEFTKDSDLSFPPDHVAHGLVHADVLLVALNPGIAAAGHVRTPWHNFHAGPRHRDHSLAEACRGTRLWGAYMTDVHPDITEGDSTRVSTGADLVRAAVESLARQIELLGARDPVIVALGHSSDPSPRNASTYRRLMNHVDVLAQVGVTPERIVGVYHYSPTAVGHYKHEPGERVEQRYRAHVHRRLAEAGLAELLTPNVADGAPGGREGGTP
ncbi:hypothetical protein [Nocardioides ferulae]|uniref:hypothetical protein n=1 Tax=Nocardioides ferulae TaxID=2340821 RepID=UPI000EB1ACA3|nr:hypothetical protein [Nocardioides ferulae]